jgi:thioredoxin 1
MYARCETEIQKNRFATICSEAEDYTEVDMAGENMIVLNENNYSEVTGTPDKLVLVDFWATWCGPCRAIGPILEKLAGEYPEQVVIGKLNVDENRALTESHGIQSIPTILLYKGGQIKDTLVGARQFADYKSVVDQYL